MLNKDVRHDVLSSLIFLERILHQLLKFVPAHIENTAAATRSLEESLSKVEDRQGEQVIICTMDVVALYPSIPIKDGVEAVLDKLDEHEEEIDTGGLSRDEIESLLSLVLQNNFFKFGEKVYRQKKGVAMGNHLAPPFAILFMDKLETKMLVTATRKPQSYDRYVDDCLVVWTHGHAHLQEFIAHCNNQHPNIRFTWDCTAGGDSVNYMDLKISHDLDNGLVYELFQKPSDSGVSLNFESCVPRHQKSSVATQHFRRAVALSSNPTARQRSESKIEALLQQNGFPSETIELAREKANKLPASRTNETDNSSDRVTLSLPFCSDHLDKEVRKIVKKSNLPVRIVYKQAPNLKQRLVRSALQPTGCTVHDKFIEEKQWLKRRPGRPREDCISCRAGLNELHCDRKFAIYLLACTICSREYVGETQRPVRARIQEHYADTKNKKKDTPWGEHVLCYHGDMDLTKGKTPIFTARVLAFEENIIERKAREAIEIRDRKPGINRNGGWQLDWVQFLF